MSKWIKKGDTVLVIAGNNKGKTGKVIARREEKLTIQGVNIRKKHVKQKTRESKGDILEFEMPLHISNVCLCTEEGKPIKLKVRTTAKGEKELFYLEGGKEVSFRQLKKLTKSY